ncbi:hypothetical protein E2562_033489 [Oryza meyeriana var. granulata]|uniref:Uncharacterized protein n=1 Tax=Oryza meyeriana var. granulata TaxID=110450 RepID=A0A6G1F124_9ORYZ|nr:hypothetical protein E2562_033489 [Oryza meyeriana var. granulata]
MKRYMAMEDQTRQEKSLSNANVVGGSACSSVCASTLAVAVAISTDTMAIGQVPTGSDGTISPLVPMLSIDEKSEDNSFDFNDEISMSQPNGGEASADGSNDATREERSSRYQPQLQI